MKPSRFVHHPVRSVAEAVAALAALAPEGGRILAGGQSLVPMMAFRLAQPAHLIDINRIPGLDRPQRRDGQLIIPACVRHAAFHQGADDALGLLLARVVRHIAHAPIRNRGTFCGSVAHADPSAEWPVVMTALDGVAVAQSEAGSRAIAAADFFEGVMTTALRPDEMLTEIRLPEPPAGTRMGFSEHSRRAGDFAQAMTLASFRLQNGLIAEARVAIGGVEPVPRRLAAVERLLTGAAPGPALWRDAADCASACVTPMEDGQTSPALRRDLLRATTRRALAEAAA